MNRVLTLRRLAHRLRVWQALTVALAALLLMGAGGLTASRLFVTGSNDPGDKLLVRVGSQDVLRVSTDGSVIDVALDAGAGGSAVIHGATLAGSTGFGDGANDRFRLPRLSADPATGLEEGMMYYNTTSKEARVYRDGAWESAGGGGLPSGAIVYSTSATDTVLLGAGMMRAAALDVHLPADDLSAGAPDGREQHTGVWTGKELIVWGGTNGSSLFNSGARYNPATGVWTPVSMTNAPSPRRMHTVVWTGTDMIVWGGHLAGGAVANSGGRYNPETDTWVATDTVGAPPGRAEHTAVWSGSLMLVWGGFIGTTQLNSGGMYDPETDLWEDIPSVNVPTARFEHSAIWAGDRMIIWGGNTGATIHNTGGSYVPGDTSWQTVSLTGAPVARRRHSAVWTGTEMIVWGGLDSAGSRLLSGGRYNPLSNSWQATGEVLAGAPSARSYPMAVWTGAEMIIWGGDADPITNTGARYDPLLDSWLPMTTTGAPDARFRGTAVWVNGWFLIWGGRSDGALRFANGGVYDPVSNAWSRRLYAYRMP